MVWPDICEIKGPNMPIIVELMPNIYEDPQGLLIIKNIWSSVTNICKAGGVQ